MSSSSGAHNGYGRGGLGGGVWEDLLPRRLGFHFHREITLQMGDPARVGNVEI
jgi:hypothetical protein